MSNWPLESAHTVARMQRARRVMEGAVLLCWAAGMPVLSPAAGFASKHVVDADELDTRSDAVLVRLYARNPGVRAMAASASGALVFPDVLVGGAVAGVEQGDGMMRVAGGSKVYYRLVGTSLGAQAGMESKAVVLMFLSPQALERFRASHGDGRWVWTGQCRSSV